MATSGDYNSDLLRASLRSYSSTGPSDNIIENGLVVHEGWLTKSPPEKRIWKSVCIKRCYWSKANFS